MYIGRDKTNVDMDSKEIIFKKLPITMGLSKTNKKNQIAKLFNKIIKHSIAPRVKIFSRDNRRDICFAKITQRIQMITLNPKGKMLNISRKMPPKKAKITDHRKLKKGTKIIRVAKMASGFTFKMRKELNSVDCRRAIISRTKIAYICLRYLLGIFKNLLLIP